MLKDIIIKIKFDQNIFIIICKNIKETLFMLNETEIIIHVPFLGTFFTFEIGKTQ